MYPTHGNGPQVGLELLKPRASADSIPTLPLGVYRTHTRHWLYYCSTISAKFIIKKGLEKEIGYFYISSKG